jgi:hypothetical protein
MSTNTQRMVLKEPKKHSVRYDADPASTRPMLQSIYISKDYLPSPAPQEIWITISTEGTRR